MFRTLIPTAIALAASAGLAQDWAAPASGNWNNAANWTPMTVPAGPGATATLGLIGPYEVTLDVTTSVGNLV
ncbi:MAG: hypothetical protein KDA28_06620, partial [Phycisphaerales bacterium]|nr:hypothetical protein [Phycisphaerales bacterium]